MSASSRKHHSNAISIINSCILLFLKIIGFLSGTVLFVGLFLGFLFKFYPWTVGYVVFMNHIHFPPFRNFTDLESVNLHGENLYLASSTNQLGVWKLDPDFYSERAPVVMYIHGAQGSRAAYHRIEMYKVLLRIGCPVVTFDYRGYGDSTGIPTSELDLLQDAMVVYQWTKDQFPGRQLFLWGHSLGTGVSIRLVQTVERAPQVKPLIDGLILDSPYSSMFDILRQNRLLYLFHQVPVFTEVLLSALKEADVTLNSSDRIRSTKIPILILHAEDDWVIPVSLGRALFQVAEQREELFPGAGVVSEYVEYSYKLKYGHRGIYRDVLLPERVQRFADRASKWRHQ